MKRRGKAHTLRVNTQTHASPSSTKRPADVHDQPLPSGAPLRASSAPKLAASAQATTVLIVVNVLPLVFERNATDDAWHVEWSSSATSMFYRTLVSDSSKYTPLFIGCPEVFIAKSEEDAVEKQLRAFACVPVFLDPTVAHRYFQGFCKGVLWPVLHNVVDVYNSAKLTLDDYAQDSQSQTTWAPAPPAPGDAFGRTNCWRDPASWNPAAQDKCWSDYCSVNRTFAKRIVESYHDGDIIWIHDFHFLMLPTYLLRKVRTALVALYLHVPFPSSEIFRCLAVRTEILRAMLCADHIGFLLYEHARHFLTSCKRLLGLSYATSSNGMLVIEYNGRKVNVSCSHIEPDAQHLHAIVDHVDRSSAGARSSTGSTLKHAIEQCIVDSAKRRKVVIASVDRLEGLAALPLKLRAFDRFLAAHPDKRASVVLVQIGLAMDSRPNDYHQTRDYVLKFVAEINRRWAPPGECVVYFEEKVKTTCTERIELWRISDVFLDTCVRSGLSLLPFEYVVTQQRSHEHCVDPSEYQHHRRAGVMVVSEFASYSRILHGCLLVNPWKTDDIVNALVRACEMQYYEKHQRFAINYKVLERRSLETTKWSERLLADVQAAVRAQQPVDAHAATTIDVGFGFDYRVMQFTSGFEHLDVDTVVRACTKTSRRLFVLDYGGTLSWTTGLLDSVDDQSSAFRSYDARRRSGSVDSFDTCDDARALGHDVIRYIDGQVRTPLSDEARANLATLCRDPHNVVFVVSTGRRAELDAAFASIEHINLVADNGFYVKKAGQAHWECLLTDSDDASLDWKDEVKRVMQAFAARTNGAYVIVTDASVVYDYRSCDPEYGEIQSQELVEQLRSVLKRGDATVERGRGFVEARQFGVSKATVLTMVLHYMKERVGVPDFALFAGDDASDELAFKALQVFAAHEPALEHVFTCTVGMKPSCAKYYVDSVSDILATIHAIAVRLRLESSRVGLVVSESSYFDAFIAHGPLVSPRFLRSLSVETDATELSDVMLLTGCLANESTGTPSPREVAPAALSSMDKSWTSGLASFLEPYVATEWLALGAAAALGCAVGVAVSSALAPSRLRRFQRL